MMGAVREVLGAASAGQGAMTAMRRLLLVDLVLIAAHCVTLVIDVLADAPGLADAFDLTRRFSVPTLYIYGKWAVAAAVLLAAWRRGGRWLGPVAAVFLALLVDDAGELHETGGGMIADAFGLPAIFGLRAKDLGELAMMAGLGVFCFGALGIAWRMAPRDQRPLVAVLALLLVLLSVFGAVVDMLHIAVVGPVEGRVLRFALDQTFVLIEDGGEMVVATMLLAAALAAAARASRREPGASPPTARPRRLHNGRRPG